MSNEKYTSGYVREKKRKKGSVWQAVVKCKDNTTGKWRETSKILPEAKGKREAKRLMEEWRAELNASASLSPNFDNNKTVAEVVVGYMDYQLRNGEIEESTYHNRKSAYDSLVEPYLKDYTFATLDRTAINMWLSKLNNRGLSQGTIALGFYTVRKVYNYYYELGEINRNPFTGVKAPKKGAPKVTHLTQTQMARFLQCIENEKPRYKVAYLLAFYAGLRRGEICGLRWRDINLDEGIISIETAIGIGDHNYAKQPKNRTSIRTFPIVPQLRDEIKIYKDSIKPKDDWFVIGWETKFCTPSALSQNFKTFTKQYELVDAYGKPLTLHMLRHNLGAVGIKSGMDIASLSAMFGHSSRSMTLDTYGDATKDAMIVATNKLTNEFNNKSGIQEDKEKL